MIAVRILVFAVGVAIALWTVLSAIRTTVLPRSAQVAISQWVYGGMRRIFELAIGRTDDFAKRDRIMALFAPMSLLALPLVWLLLIGFAYTLMFWAIDTSSYTEAMALSGSSLTTLGFVAKETAGE